MLFGEYLVKHGELTQEQVDEIIRVQSKTVPGLKERKLFGDIAVGLGYLDKNTIEKVFIEYFNNQ